MRYSIKPGNRLWATPMTLRDHSQSGWPVNHRTHASTAARNRAWPGCRARARMEPLSGNQASVVTATPRFRAAIHPAMSSTLPSASSR
jgi:hypothetical protein